MTAATRVVEPGPGLAGNPLLVSGDAGEPVVYLHGPYGQEWPGLLEDLSRSRRVLAPANPGIVNESDLDRLADVRDLVLYYDSLFDSLGLESFDLIGHSYGGMVAAEYAATFRRRVRRLVLISPLGLWRDSDPVTDYVAISPQRKAAVLPFSPAATPASTSDETEELIARLVAENSATAATSHFSWPLMEQGLAGRLSRIRSRTLIVWGTADEVASPNYASDFAAGIDDATLAMITGGSHAPFAERSAETSSVISAFLAG